MQMAKIVYFVTAEYRIPLFQVGGKDINTQTLQAALILVIIIVIVRRVGQVFVEALIIEKNCLIVLELNLMGIYKDE